ncbi:MAG TPA: caspase family protein [Kofleriaceae bacterium]|jgi:uncharacterized caspase-like protein/very-short-patch-repair endonuclease
MRKPVSGYRDIAGVGPKPSRVHRGRRYVAAIGIDAYSAWSPLHNAVQDARGALDAFVELGFEPFGSPLLDHAATGAALRHLVTDQLRGLGQSDSLVVFFAGHGHTGSPGFSTGTDVKVPRHGYLIPVDADGLDGSIGTWLRLDHWLNDIAQLPPQHILVILDSCHSGIALDPETRWRSESTRLAEPMESLGTRRSRRVLTSALDDEVAMDGGPIAGHSLFTGCLIEALGGDLFAKLQRPVAAASELWTHVRQRVFSFSSQKNWKQTPEFGRLDFDDHGELLVQLPDAAVRSPRRLEVEHGDPPRKTGRTARAVTTPMRMDRKRSGRRRTTAPSLREPERIEPARDATKIDVQVDATREGKIDATRASGSGSDVRISVSATRPGAVKPAGFAPGAPATARQDRRQPTRPPAPRDPGGAAPQTGAPERSGAELDTAFVAALDRHDAERRRGASVLSTVSGDPATTLRGWATWAARRGYLTLVTEHAALEAALCDLLPQAPWLRCLGAARTRLAAAANLALDEVDAALDARSEAERTAWIDEVADLDRHARVSGWLLSALRQPRACAPDPTTAPVQGGELLSILCDLAAPITVLMHRAQPTATWLEAAIRTAAALVGRMPLHSVAVAAPSPLLAEVLRGRDSAALSMARQGLVTIGGVPAAPSGTHTAPSAGRAHSRAGRRLHDALARDPRTSGRFALDMPVSVGGRATVEVDLLAKTARLAVEIDRWYHSCEPEAYRRDRTKDVLLQRAGYFVMRFLAEDVEDRLALIVDDIATGLGGRRAASPS